MSSNSFIPKKQATNHCLHNYIGMRGCGIDTPNSAAYVNELPGISLKNIDNIADSEQLNFNGVWADIQARALRKFDTDVQNYLGKRHKLNSPIETINMGLEVNADPDYQTDERYYLQGLRVNINYGSQLQVIHVQELNLYSLKDHPNLIILFFERGDDGIYYQIDYIVAEIFSNVWNNIYIGRNYTAKDLYIAYPGKEIIAPRTNVNIYNGSLSCCNVTINGVEQLVEPEGEPIVKVNNTFGLSAILSIRCNWNAFVCNNKSLFTQSLLLLYGIELMNERIHSPRLNQYTLFGADKAKQLRDELVAQYREELDSVLSTASFGADCCVECNDVVTFKERRP